MSGKIYIITIKQFFFLKILFQMQDTWLAIFAIYLLKFNDFVLYNSNFNFNFHFFKKYYSTTTAWKYKRENSFV